MNQEFQRQLEQLPANLTSHLQITILPLLLGLAISLPLAVLAVRRKAFRYPVLTVVSVIQTIPSLALLALMVPVLVGLNKLLAVVGAGNVPELGFIPTVTALTLYSMLPILRNTVTGIEDVDPTLKEAARGVGMTPWQILWKVELPLALPVIVAGIRTATVWTVGIATLATPVGQRCLGNYIYQGLHTRNWTAVLFGCVAAAVLAVTLDLLIGLLQRAAEQRRPLLAAVAGTVLVLLFGVGLLNPKYFQGSRSVVVLASKPFTEQYILVETLTQRLRRAGFSVQHKESLGSTIIFDGLASGEIDCYVDYTGTIWATAMKRKESASADEVLQSMDEWLGETRGIRDLGPLGFENAYAFAMPRTLAERLNIQTLSQLQQHAPELRMGGDLEFFDRPEWRQAQRVYGLSFQEKTPYASTFMYEAIRRGEVDVVSAFTTDGRIDAYDLVLLKDDRNAIPPYDAVLLLSPDAAQSDEIVQALQPFIGSISNELMREANYLVDRADDKQSVGQAADWLTEQIFPQESSVLSAEKPQSD